MFNSFWLHGLQLTRLLCPWDSPGKSTVVGCHFLLQGIFPNQGSNPGLLNCRQILYCLSHQGIIGKEPWKYESGYLYRRGTAPPFLWKKGGRIFSPWKGFWVLTFTFWDANKSFQWRVRLVSPAWRTRNVSKSWVLSPPWNVNTHIHLGR